MQKLQIGAAVGAGISQFFGKFGSALKIGWVPLVILVVVHGIAALLVIPELETIAREQGEIDTQDEAAAQAMMTEIARDLLSRFAWLGIVVILATIAAYIMLTTGWLRHLLRGNVLTGRMGICRFGGREFRMLGAAFLLMLAFGIVGTVVVSLVAGLAFAGGVPATLVMLVVYVAMTLVFMRLSLVFPMVALDQGVSWVTVWRIGKGNSWRLFWTYFLISLFVSVLSFVGFLPVGLVTGFAGALAPGSISFGLVLPLLAYDAIYVAGFMLTLGALADAYRQLNGPGVGVPERDLAVFDD